MFASTYPSCAVATAAAFASANCKQVKTCKYTIFFFEAKGIGHSPMAASSSLIRFK
jgi:hypothetical protein